MAENANKLTDRIHYILPYLPGVLTIVIALPVWFAAGPILGILAGVLGMGCTLTCHRILVRVREISDQKACLDAQLIQSQKLAAIGELSSGIAHEINNPLAIIGQEVQWIRHIVDKAAIGSEHHAELDESVTEIGKQVKRCAEITHKLLDFARKRDPLIQGCDVNRLIEDMVRLVERETAQKNIAIVRNYHEGLPELYTDHPLLRQVILNLLNNATYAIDKDGTITVKTLRKGQDALEILITDTGCGITSENIRKVFNPFFTTKPPGKGTGLGLSLCHSIIHKLGGDIRVESEPGKGATFIIRLPMNYAEGENLI
ncbi:Histidine kinase [uncultured Desulfobacterium sp.]|uniref:histidine kinase n=1 Tax=uncultured Desulfobacterium sp. TaxID=201089 RepID=A0A445MY81_9BACT|nr:Histidine kinase [uncultured Desulfobacterium sp.]